MNILFVILLAMAGILALLLIIAFLMKKEHYVKHEIIINAPRQKVFDFIKLLKNQDAFNKHAMAGPDRKKEFKGQTEQLDTFMPGAEIKMQVKEKRKSGKLMKEKALKQKFVL